MIWPGRRRRRRHKPAADLRRLMPADAAIWRDLRLAALLAHPEAYGSTHDDWAGAPLSDFAARLEAGFVLGAFIGGALVGSAALDPLPGAPETGEITAVYVAPVHRGQGIARGLMAGIDAAARHQGMTDLCLSVATVNTAAMAFYAAAGFQPAGQEPRALARNGQMLELIRMARPIRA